MSEGNSKVIAKKITALIKVKKGEHLKIVSIPEGIPRTQLIRFGLIEGDIIKCVENLPGGTIVIQKNRQEIALGSKLANKIIVMKI